LDGQYVQISKWLQEDVWYYTNNNKNIVSRWKWSEESKAFLQLPMIHSLSTGIVVRKCIFGEGAERIVFAMREARLELTNSAEPCKIALGQEMVAKESRFVDQIQTFQVPQVSFHLQFCKTQQIAQKIASAGRSE